MGKHQYPMRFNKAFQSKDMKESFKIGFRNAVVTKKDLLKDMKEREKQRTLKRQSEMEYMESDKKKMKGAIKC